MPRRPAEAGAVPSAASRRRRSARALALLAPLALGVGACGEDDGGAVRDLSEDGATASGASGSAAGSGSGSGSTAEATCVEVGDPSSAEVTVEATLTEFAIALGEASAPAGVVALEAVNEGEDVHEIVVARTDLDASALPTAEDGSVDEDAVTEAGGEIIGEIEGFPAGETCAGAFELAAGDYVLFCNIVETEDDGTVEAHYAEGMATSFSVT